MIVINQASIRKDIRTTKDYAYTKLYRMSKQGMIQKICKGKYAAANDVLAVATNIHTPSYLSFWSCSQYKGYTEQVLNTLQIATTRRYRRISYDGYIIEFIQVKDFFGYTRQGEAFIAEDEKLLIDVMSHEKHIGNFDEIEKLFRNATVNREKIIAYLEKTGNNTLVKRVGYMLERYKGIDISKNFELDRNYARLTIYHKGHIIDKKWRVKHDFKK